MNNQVFLSIELQRNQSLFKYTPSLNKVQITSTLEILLLLSYATIFFYPFLHIISCYPFYTTVI